MCIPPPSVVKEIIRNIARIFFFARKDTNNQIKIVWGWGWGNRLLERTPAVKNMLAQPLKRKRPMRLIRARFCSKEIIISDNWPLPRNIGLRDVRISDLCVMVLRYSNCLYLSTANKYCTSVRQSTDKNWQLLKKLHWNFLEIYGNFPPTLESEKFLMYISQNVHLALGNKVINFFGRFFGRF